MEDEFQRRQQLAKAWLHAGEDLGISVVAPFVLEADDDLLCVALVGEFGAEKGMLVMWGGPIEWKGTRDQLEMATLRGYGFSFMTEPYTEYDRTAFIELLDDWGWKAPGTPPDWYTAPSET